MRGFIYYLKSIHRESRNFQLWFLHRKYFFIFRLSFTAFVQKVKSYIKDTNHFLKKVRELGQLPEGTIFCTIDVVGLYQNITHDEGLAFLNNFLDSRVDKQVKTDILITDKE